MKIDRLHAGSTRSSLSAPSVTSLTEAELRCAAAGVAPFSCAFLDNADDGSVTIQYHDGYPRH